MLVVHGSIRLKPFFATARVIGRWTAAYACLSSIAATEVASHWLGVEIALRLAAATRTLGRIAGRGAPRLFAVTAYYRRAKTPDRILLRDERKVPVIGPVPLCAFPGRGPRRQTGICPACRRGDHEQRAQPDTKNLRHHLLDPLARLGI